MTKLKVGQKLYDYAYDDLYLGEIIAIDNKGRYICEFEGLDEVFAFDKLPDGDVLLEEKKQDWIDEVIENLDSTNWNDFTLRRFIEKYCPLYKKDL